MKAFIDTSVGLKPGPPSGIVGPENGDAEKGAITAEFATTLPVVMMLLAVVMALAAVFGTQFRVSDAARTGARLAALGSPVTEINSAITSISGANALVNIDLEPGGQWVTVTVRQSIQVGPLWLGPLRVNSSATAWVEP